MIEPFEVYRLYMGVKLHFSPGSYDFFKYNGKTHLKKAAFLKRNDKAFFYRVSTQYKTVPEILDYFVANFALSDKEWVGDMSETVYMRYKDMIESIDYTYRKDLHELLDVAEHLGFTFRELFKSTTGKETVLVQTYMQNLISVSSLVILEDLMRFSGYIDQTFGWEAIQFKLSRLRPFLKYDRAAALTATREILLPRLEKETQKV